jgi:predicted metalloprotease with PDZ domain
MLAAARPRLMAALAAARAWLTAVLAGARARLEAARRNSPRAAPGRHAVVTTRRRRRLTVATLTLAVLVAAGAYGLASTLGSGSSGPATATGPAPWIGVQMQSLPVGGVVIVTVVPGGPAEAAGLEPGDVITTIDNRPVNSAADVSSALAGMHAGDEVEIGISRGSTLLTIPVTLASRPPGSP